MLVLVKRMSREVKDKDGKVIKPSKAYHQLARDGRFVYTDGKPVFGSSLGIGLNPKNGNLILDTTKSFAKQMLATH